MKQPGTTLLELEQRLRSTGVLNPSIPGQVRKVWKLMKEGYVMVRLDWKRYACFHSKDDLWSEVLEAPYPDDPH